MMRRNTKQEDVCKKGRRDHTVFVVLLILSGDLHISHRGFGRPLSSTQCFKQLT